MDEENLRILIERGSATARGGFSNERDVVDKFNNWRNDEDAKKWLGIMEYTLEEIEDVKARQITGSHKTDVQIEIKIFLREGIAAENISIKLVSNPQGFNQIDKRWVDNYTHLWTIPNNIISILKKFTGETRPTRPSPRDNRRIFLDEISRTKQGEVINFFERNKIMIVTDLFRGRDNFPASWMLIYQKDTSVWTLLPMSLVMNFYGNGPVVITSQGSLKIGRIGMQRKGGDNGRPTANMLQFKINPCEIVNSPENGHDIE